MAEPTPEPTPASSPAAAHETWVSVDVETSGPTLSTGSLLAIGACLVERPEDGLEVLLKPDPALPWRTDAAAIHGLDRATLLRDGLDPGSAAVALDRWLVAVTPVGSRPVFVGLNAGFDWPFVADLLWRHLGRNPFGPSGLDIKSLYLGLHLGEGLAWRDTARSAIRERYPVDLEHTHGALDDAREQAALVRAILAAGRAGGTPA